MEYVNAILDFLNKNSGAIQAIAIIVMIIVTWWYAHTTNKMAKVMQKDFELKLQPIVLLDPSIRRNFWGTDNKSIQLVFNIKNGGVLPVVFEHESSELSQISICPEKKAFILFPDQSIDLYSNIATIPDLEYPCIGAIWKIKIKFWSHSNPNLKYFIQREFTLISENMSFIEKDEFWIFP